MQLKLGISGDVMLGHTFGGYSQIGVSGRMKEAGIHSVFGDVLPSLWDMDVNLFNLEFVMTDTTPDPDRCCKFRAPINISVAALHAAKLNLAVVANNHQKDFGDSALHESLQSLEKAGIPWAGASFDKEKRWMPRIVDVAGKPLRIAVLAFLRSESAGELSYPRTKQYENDGPPWIAYVRESCIVDPASACGALFRSRLRAAREAVVKAGGANLTVLSMHWGGSRAAAKSGVLREDCHGPFMPHHLPFARFVHEVLSSSDLQIDIFVANHPHNFQTYQTIAGKPVINSPGQFIDDFQRPNGAGVQLCPLTNRLGLRYELRYDCGAQARGQARGQAETTGCALSSVQIQPVHIDNYTVRFAPPNLESRAISRVMRTAEVVGGVQPERRRMKVVVRDAKAKLTRIMPMGDSLTQSCCCKSECTRCCGDRSGEEAHVCCRASYRQHLYALLSRHLGLDSFTFVGSQERGYACDRDASLQGYNEVDAPQDLSNTSQTGFPVAHEGHWGWTTAQLAQWTQTFVRQAVPDVMLLMIGLNDLIHNATLSKARHEANAFDSILQNIERIVHTALRLRPSIKVFVGTLPECRRQPYQPVALAKKSPVLMCPFPEAIQYFNLRLIASIQAMNNGSRLSGKKAHAVEPCNVADGFDAASMTFDGLHPNAAGERHLAEGWYSCLKGPHRKARLDHILPASTRAYDVPAAIDVERAKACTDAFARGRWAYTERQQYELGAADFYGKNPAAACGSSDPNCFSMAWTPMAGSSSLNSACTRQYTRFNSSGIRRLLRGKFVAFLGDSSLRLVFSSLVHALNGSLVDPSFPTHDFTFTEHSYSDHCRTGNCYREFVWGQGEDQIRVSFDMWRVIADYPDRATRFFFGTSKSRRAVPDFVVFNSGAWEFYKTRFTSDAYTKKLWQFLAHLAELWSGPTFWLSNTYAEKPPTTYFGSENAEFQSRTGRQCNQLHKRQAPILEYFRHVMIDRSPLFMPLPEVYNSSAGIHNPYHLPGIISDESLQLLLNVALASVSVLGDE